MCTEADECSLIDEGDEGDKGNISNEGDIVLREMKVKYE